MSEGYKTLICGAHELSVEGLPGMRASLMLLAFQSSTRMCDS